MLGTEARWLAIAWHLERARIGREASRYRPGAAARDRRVAYRRDRCSAGCDTAKRERGQRVRLERVEVRPRDDVNHVARWNGAAHVDALHVVAHRIEGLARTSARRSLRRQARTRRACAASRAHLRTARYAQRGGRWMASTRPRQGRGSRAPRAASVATTTPLVARTTSWPSTSTRPRPSRDCRARGSRRRAAPGRVRRPAAPPRACGRAAEVLHGAQPGTRRDDEAHVWPPARTARDRRAGAARRARRTCAGSTTAPIRCQPPATRTDRPR